MRFFAAPHHCETLRHYSCFEPFAAGSKAVSWTTGSRADPSRDRHQRSARDTALSNEGLPRYRVEGPSTSDTECRDPMLRPEGEHLHPRAEGLRHGGYLPVA